MRPNIIYQALNKFLIQTHKKTVQEWNLMIVTKQGKSDSRDVSCFRASYMGKFSWADMVLGMLDANIYI